MIDAGWMALSQDRGPARQTVDHGSGLVCDLTGNCYPDLLLASASQEHGIITVRPGSNGTLPALAIGDGVRILPNHACATAAQHLAYHVVRGTDPGVEVQWSRFGGW